LVTTKIPLVAMKRRDQWNFFSVRRNNFSVGRDASPQGILSIFQNKTELISLSLKD
jgi:hypothetical protein